MRYFVHPESDCFFEAEDFNFEGVDGGLVSELTQEEYIRMKRDSPRNQNHHNPMGQTPETEKRMPEVNIAPIIGVVRLSYLNVFKPRFNQLKGRELFDVTILIPKEPNPICANPKEITDMIRSTVKQVAADKFGNSAKFTWPIKDGDKELDGSDAPKNPGYWYMRLEASLEYPPTLLDGNKRPVTGGWQSGDWGKVKVKFYAYDKGGNKGVNAGLVGIQFCFKGEPLGSSYDPDAIADEFGTVEGAHTSKASTTSGSDPGDNDDPFADN